MFYNKKKMFDAENNWIYLQLIKTKIAGKCLYLIVTFYEEKIEYF